MKSFCLLFILSCLPLFLLIFPKIILKCLKSNNRRCRESMKRSNSFRPTWKKRQRPAALSVLLRRWGRGLRPRQERKPRSKGLWKRRINRSNWSTWSDSRMGFWPKTLPFWRALKLSRSWNLNTRRSSQKTRRNNSFLGKLKENDQESTKGCYS